MKIADRILNHLGLCRKANVLNALVALQRHPHVKQGVVTDRACFDTARIAFWG